MPKINMVEAINSALRGEMKRDSNVVLLGEDIGINGGVFRVTEGLRKKFGEMRVIDTPISESGIVGCAIGMAAFGLRPVVEIQFAAFMYAALEQLISHASRIRMRSRGRFTCPIVLRAPCSGGVHALEHHQESMEAIYAHVPGLKVVMPSTPYDAKGLLAASIRSPDPVIFFEPTRLYRSVKEDVPEKDYTIEIGKASIVREGSDVTLVSYGTMMTPCRDAAEDADAQGISIELIDLRTLSPLDSETLLNSVAKTGRCVIVHEAPRSFGIGAEIAAQICEKNLLKLKAPVARVTGFDTVSPLAKLEEFYLPNRRRIMIAIKEVMGY